MKSSSEGPTSAYKYNPPIATKSQQIPASAGRSPPVFTRTHAATLNKARREIRLHLPSSSSLLQPEETLARPVPSRLAAGDGRCMIGSPPLELPANRHRQDRRRGCRRRSGARVLRDHPPASTRRAAPIGIWPPHVEGEGLHRRQRPASQGVLGLRGAHRPMGVSVYVTSHSNTTWRSLHVRA
jgi:hypothetical protein